MRAEKCQCGHERAAHEHYRSGTECAQCPPGACPRYKGPRLSWWRKVIPAGFRRKRAATIDLGSERQDDESWDDGVAGGSASIALGAGVWAFPRPLTAP